MALASYTDWNFVLSRDRGGTLKPQPVTFCAWSVTANEKRKEDAANRNIFFIAGIFI
jgi:hypothetical protein